MPCYEVRTVTVEFQARNLELLKRAARADGWLIHEKASTETTLKIYRPSGAAAEIDLRAGTITGTASVAAVNGLKRAYSAAAIAEVAKRKRWLLKRRGAVGLQLQKF